MKGVTKQLREFTWIDAPREDSGHHRVSGYCVNCENLHTCRPERIRNGMHLCSQCRGLKYEQFDFLLKYIEPTKENR